MKQNDIIYQSDLNVIKLKWTFFNENLLPK